MARSELEYDTGVVGQPANDREIQIDPVRDAEGLEPRKVALQVVEDRAQSWAIPIVAFEATEVHFARESQHSGHLIDVKPDFTKVLLPRSQLDLSELVDVAEDLRLELRRYADRLEQRAEQASIRDPCANVLGREPELPHDLHGNREQLGVSGDARLADDIDIQLKMFAKATALLPLVPKELWNGEPTDGFAQSVRLRSDHPRQRWRHFGPQRHAPAALVLELVQLGDDLVTAFLRVEIE
jgi:hypothetical protein